MANTERMFEQEQAYRFKKGVTIAGDDALCEHCRNYNRTDRFCWDCDRGSLYVPLTFPLYTIVLLLSSLRSGLESATDKEGSDSTTLILQQGFIAALIFAIQPFGTFEAALAHFADEMLSDEAIYRNPKDIEKVFRPLTTIDHTVSEDEKRYRAEFGAIACHQNACEHCKYFGRLDTPFCWDCNRGSHFKNGIRLLHTLSKTLMYINTTMGEALQSGHRDERKTVFRTGFAEGIKWLIKPTTTEEQLIEAHGNEYITKELFDSIVKREDEDYAFLDNQ
jgi:hypothetical protein